MKDALSVGRNNPTNVAVANAQSQDQDAGAGLDHNHGSQSIYRLLPPRVDFRQSPVLLSVCY